MSLSQEYELLEKDIKNLQLNFTQIFTSDSHYYTQELINHIKHINNALDNIKLDYEFQRGSKSWAKQFDSNEMKSNETNVQQLISKGHELARQLNTGLHTNTIQNKEENQIREIHTWACDSLLDYLQALHPYASGSYARLDNMAHHLGVTDRYVGYRNNLNRNENQPLYVHSIWADRKLPQTSTTPDWKNWAHAFEHYGPSTTTAFQQSSNVQSSNTNPTLLGYMKTTQPTEMQRPNAAAVNHTSQPFIYANDHNTHMKKAGMSVTYPGQTESKVSYITPQGSYHSLSLPVAQPDYTSIGRPLSRLAPEPKSSEYSHSYALPDASKIEKYPWLRS